MSWWAAFLCLTSSYDYSVDIAEAVGGGYCATLTAPDVGLVLDVFVASEPPPVTFAEVMGWDPDPWVTYYIVTAENRTDEPEVCGGHTTRYWVGCIDRVFGEECLHDCIVLTLHGGR